MKKRIWFQCIMGFVLLWIFAVVSLPLRGEDRKPLLPCIGCSSQGYNIANGWTEAVGTNEIKLQVISDLEEMGIPVLSAPYRNARTQKENDTYGLKERADYANEHKADIYIELHTDSARDFEGVTGTMGVYYDSDDKDLAQFFVERTARAMGLKERPLFLKKCYVLTKTTMPACIIEILNHSDPDDALLLKDTAWQKKYAGALAEAIKEYCTGGH